MPLHRHGIEMIATTTDVVALRRMSRPVFHCRTVCRACRSATRLVKKGKRSVLIHETLRPSLADSRRKPAGNLSGTAGLTTAIDLSRREHSEVLHGLALQDMRSATLQSGKIT